jgi:hypothetical protein
MSRLSATCNSPASKAPHAAIRWCSNGNLQRQTCTCNVCPSTHACAHSAHLQSSASITSQLLQARCRHQASCTRKCAVQANRWRHASPVDPAMRQPLSKSSLSKSTCDTRRSAHFDPSQQSMPLGPTRMQSVVLRMHTGLWQRACW